MPETATDALTRYVRLLVHHHPMRSHEFVSRLADRGMRVDEITRDVLVPARQRLLRLKAAHLLNATDLAIALGTIRAAFVRLSVNERPTQRQPAATAREGVETTDVAAEEIALRD